MTEVAAPAGTTAQGVAPVDAPSPNMTGEEAKAWVEAQKQKYGGKDNKKSEKTPSFGSSKEPATGGDPIKEAAQEAKRKLKISEQEELDEEEAIKIIRDRKQHQQAANKILQEGKMARKQAEEFVTMMKDPAKFFEIAAKLGHNPRELTEKYLVSQLEEEMLDPKERSLRDAQKRLEHFEREEKRRKEEAEAKELNILKDQYAKKYTDDFVKALDEIDLPKTNDTIARMAKITARAAKLGMPITAVEAATLAKQQLHEERIDYIKTLSPEQMIKMFGDDFITKIRKYEASKIRNPDQFLSTPERQQSERRHKPAESKTKSSMEREWRRLNRTR